MSGRRMSFDEAFARLNELLNDVDLDVIDKLRRRMRNIAQSDLEVRAAVLIDGLREFIPEAWGGLKIEAEQWLADFLGAHPFGDKTCDTCGEPATVAARHVLERWDPIAADQQFEPGKTRYGCGDHPVESEIIRVTDDEILRAVQYPDWPPTSRSVEPREPTLEELEADELEHELQVDADLEAAADERDALDESTPPWER